MATERKQTVWSATYDLLRALGLTTIFGNPGSTVQPFLKNFPADEALRAAMTRLAELR